MKWEDHRSWVLSSVAAAVIAIAAAFFSVVYGAYYNQSHHVANWSALSPIFNTPVPLWFVFLLMVSCGSLAWALLRARNRMRYLESRVRDSSLDETVKKYLLNENARLIEAAAEMKKLETKVHVSWSISEGHWSLREINGEMYMGFFGRAAFSTSNATETVMLTQAYLEGTKAWGNIMLTKIPVGELVHEHFHVFLKPVLGVLGEAFSARFIFVDTKGREYLAPEHTFSSIAPLASVPPTPIPMDT